MRTDVQVQFDEERIRLETQIATLNENLKTLRADMTTSQARSSDVEKTAIDLKQAKSGKYDSIVSTFNDKGTNNTSVY